MATQDNNESAYRNSWQYAAEMTRKAEMEAQMAELKSQEAYKWCVAGSGGGKAVAIAAASACEQSCKAEVSVGLPRGELPVRGLWFDSAWRVLGGAS